jgi:hypothetical protein
MEGREVNMKNKKEESFLDALFGLDDPEEEFVDEDDLAWGLAVPEGWKNRSKHS